MLRRPTTIIAFALIAAANSASAQQTDTRLTVQRIYASREFASGAMPRPNWLADGRSILEVRPGAGTLELARVDAVTGARTVIVNVPNLADQAGRAISVEDVTLSPDESKALLFHSSVRVWRQNTRGVYHVLDFATKRLTPVSTGEGLQMFAKFSPDGGRVAFVRNNNLFVTDLATGRETQLTRDGSETIINGTTDWVYEEELGLRDAFRWSPDGRHIAFWRFDQAEVPTYPLVDPMGMYPRIQTLRYPKVGEPNSKVQVGVLHLDGSQPVTWMDVGRGNDQYLARMEWVGNDSVVIQRMPRSQASVDVIMASANTGGTRLVFTDRDSAYVDVERGDLHWNGNGRQFLWLSDRSGWRQVFLHDRNGRVVRQLTQDGMDVLDILAMDERNGHVYVLAAAPTPMERNVYRVSLRGGPAQRITTGRGSHNFAISPTYRYALDFHSDINTPATATVYELPAMRSVRVAQDNAQLRQRVQALGIRPAEFIKVPMPDGTLLDGYRITPANFDSTKRHPVLMYVYGGPAAPTVNDAWGGATYLWFQMLAQQGYVVISVDNRGAAWRGRNFRKVTQLQLGVRESQDQVDVARWLGRQSWADAGRIGIWGWSYGGYLSALTAARGGSLFRAALSVAPVTDWRLYDTIYTERFMRTPQENPEGYRAGAVATYVDSLRARILLVHGTGDDNVHPDNTLQLADRLARSGKLFYTILYPNRTHSISEGGVTPQLRETFTRFLLETL